jgi:hypothetical protein
MLFDIDSYEIYIIFKVSSQLNICIIYTSIFHTYLLQDCFVYLKNFLCNPWLNDKLLALIVMSLF